ncbi:type II toxin-antitoxin system HicB family antitoxin [Candidatus Sumerlaeota bacterium]|nr:type II toxin-antitoxin system HicB family antitoxin [Candidatus Sumerlaeota bacterium]
MHNEFTAVIEAAEEGGFVAFCPEVPGANGQGETAEEAKENLAQAIALILADRREDGLRGVPPEARREIVKLQ